MSRSSSIYVCIILLTICVVVSAQTGNYKRYTNARFEYSISYPSSLVPQGEAANGDGQKFLSKDGSVEMLVYGSNNSLDQKLSDVYKEHSANRHITYQVLRQDWFVISGTDGSKVFYQKTMLHNGVFKTFQIEYDQAVKEKWDSITARIARSFKG